MDREWLLAAAARCAQIVKRIQFRAEAYNAFNNVNFIQPSLALQNPSTFGEYQNTMPPREMQFALRYEF